MSNPEENAFVAALPEAVAERLIARAIAVDTERRTRMPIARLREIALEAGISATAFETALSELAMGKLHAAPMRVERRPGRVGAIRDFFSRLGRRLALPFSWELASDAPILWSVPGLLDALATNVIVLAMFWIPNQILLDALLRLSIVQQIHGAVPVVMVVDVVVFLALALRLRARLAAISLAIVLAYATVGMASALITLRPGSYIMMTPLGTLLGASLGVALGVMMTRRRRHRADRTPNGDNTTAIAHAKSASSNNDDLRRPFLRLRAIFAN